MNNDQLTCDVLVVGSGPGGAVTAMILAEAGVDVILAEEGPSIALTSAKPYSLEEMESKYRYGGMSVAFGNPKMNYLEGRCVGGASEINAGLYNEPSAETIEGWARDFKIENLSADALMPLLKENEKILKVTAMQEGLGPGSQILQEGAEQLGWKGLEIARMWNYSQTSPEGNRRSMSLSLIPRALKAGCRLFSGVKIDRVHHAEGRAEYVLTEDNRKIFFKNVFICGGAIQTPFLLLKSGITKNIGSSLRVHPAMRTVARFEKTASDEKEGVPVYQVTQFKPHLTLGGSFSGLPHLALWLAGNKTFSQKIADYQQMGIFYALIMGEGKGSIKYVPGVKDPLVSFNLTDMDLKNLGEGLYRLGELLFAAGALEIYSPLQNELVFKNLDEMSFLRQGLPRAQVDCSTLHLFSSCPMGEVATSAVDSWGKVHGFSNLYLNDASILPGSPGVNPQAVIMGIARRNALKFL